MYNLLSVAADAFSASPLLEMLTQLVSNRMRVLPSSFKDGNLHQCVGAVHFIYGLPVPHTWQDS